MNRFDNIDCVEGMKSLADNSVDACITDPPYELGFMGKHWDNSGIAYDVEMWKEVYRVLKPGGHLLSFSGTRTYHRMAVAIEDAGFEVRDMIEWVYGSGFPKSLNIGKAVDKLNDRFYDKGFQDYCNELRTKKGYTHSDINKLMGTALTGGGFSSSIMGDKHFNELPTVEMYNKLKPILEMDNRYDELIKRIEREREVVGRGKAGLTAGTIANFAGEKEFDLTKGTSEYEGWGTALKPAHEPICMARKPLAEKTVAENCLKWGTGGINIDESRVECNENRPLIISKSEKSENAYGDGLNGSKSGGTTTNARFPANLIHDNSEEVRECFPETKSSIGLKKKAGDNAGGKNAMGNFYNHEDKIGGHNDSGNASRFFKSIIYTAKASKSERNKGCEGLEEKDRIDYGGFHSEKGLIENNRNPENRKPTTNNHPTVKPLALMEYLIRMVTPKGGIVLDPFAGSAATLIACNNLGFSSIGFEKEKEYHTIGMARMNNQELKLEI